MLNPVLPSADRYFVRQLIPRLLEALDEFDEGARRDASTGVDANRSQSAVTYLPASQGRYLRTHLQHDDQEPKRDVD